MIVDFEVLINFVLIVRGPFLQELRGDGHNSCLVYFVSTN
jgi:hypothetical protein